MMTIQQLCDDVLETARVDKLRAIPDTERRIRLHIIRLLGEKDATALTKMDLVRYAAVRQREPVCLTRHVQPCKKCPTTGAATINREMAILRRGFSLNPQALVWPGWKKLDEPEARQGVWEPEQFEALLLSVAVWVRPPLRLAYVTGWRMHSTILPLEWSMVDFDWNSSEGVVKVPAELMKNKRGLDLPMNDELRQLFRRQHENRIAGSLWVFHRGDGKRMKCIRTAFENARDRIGNPERLFHDLRRTAMTNMVLKRGIPLSVAMKITGHLDPSVAIRYGIVQGDDVRQALRAVDGITPKTAA